MIPAGRFRRLRIRILLLLLTFLSLSCGSTDFAGGGTGGTGISTGAVSGYGSVVVNNVHYRTDDEVAPGFHTKKVSNGSDKSSQKDRDVFSVGMVVRVRHGKGDNNAQVIEYRDNLRGPIAVTVSGADNVIEILGQTVVVDDTAIFAALKQGDIVEVSGFVDNAGRIRAAYILPMAPPMPPPAQEFEVKGFVSESSSAGFRLGPLPDGSGMTVMVSYPPGGPANGTYVEVVTTDREPVGGVITATRIAMLAARTEFADGTPVELEGLVTTPWSGSVNDFSFAVEGKRVQWDADTEFVGGARNDTRQTNRRVLVQGTESGGILSAVRIVFR
jgi:hypothetical protein